MPGVKAAQQEAEAGPASASSRKTRRRPAERSEELATGVSPTPPIRQFRFAEVAGLNNSRSRAGQGRAAPPGVGGREADARAQSSAVTQGCRVGVMRKGDWPAGSEAQPPRDSCGAAAAIKILWQEPLLRGRGAAAERARRSKYEAALLNVDKRRGGGGRALLGNAAGDGWAGPPTRRGDGGGVFSPTPPHGPFSPRRERGWAGGGAGRGGGGVAIAQRT